VFWPMLVVAIGNTVLTVGILQGWPVAVMDEWMRTYSAALWLTGALLILLALERFLWQPLERRSQRKIPKLIRFVVAGIVVIGASLSVLALVYGGSVAKVMASLGVLSLVIGLALKGNLANIFSGIVLNIERPFRVGDILKINSMDSVEVVDMTWRTVRLKNPSNHVISIPNDVAARSTVLNYSMGFVRVDIPLQLSPQHPPEKVVELLKEAMERVEGIHAVKPTHQSYRGVQPVLDQWVAEYMACFFIPNADSQLGFKIKVWNAIWQRLHEAGISMDPLRCEPLPLPALAPPSPPPPPVATHA